MELGENGADGGSLSFGGLERLWVGLGGADLYYEASGKVWEHKRIGGVIQHVCQGQRRARLLRGTKR